MKNNPLNKIILGVVLILLMINIVLFASLIKVKHQIIDVATQAIKIIQQAKKQSLATPFVANVTIDNIFDVPIKTVVPIRATVDVPVVIPIIGQRVTITVPINTEVPINTMIKVPIKTSIPVDVKVGDLPFFNNILQQFDNLLVGVISGL
jgi:hypothetical protein